MNNNLMKDPKEVFDRAVMLMGKDRVKDAKDLCEGLVESYPNSVNAWVLLSQLNLKLGEAYRALMCAKKAYSLSSDRPKASLQLAACLLDSGDNKQALLLLSGLEERFSHDSITLKSIADLYVRCDHYNDACRCYESVLEVDSQDNHSRYLYSGALVGLGRLEEAELLINSVLVTEPLHYEAILSRSSITKKTIDNNNVSELKRLLDCLECTKEGIVLIYYSLAKELEDLERYKESFSYLSEGAKLNDNILSYDVGRDVENIDKFLKAYDSKIAPLTTSSDLGDGVIFVLGLPRVGSTLADRILSSHSDVKSLGETSDFHYSLLESSGHIQKEKGLDFISALEFIDYKRLGESYLKRVAKKKGSEQYVVDKTPNNALYLGLIKKALPGAKVIHIHKNPMDSCYSLYKVLFKSGYPFSYDLDKLAKYYIAHNSMMSFWADSFPDGFMNLKYEDLVSDQLIQTNRLLGYCGLGWQESCIDFHKNESPTATASVVQVRSPMNTKAVNKWKLYSDQLRVVSDRLSASGIEIN